MSFKCDRNYTHINFIILFLQVQIIHRTVCSNQNQTVIEFRSLNYVTAIDVLDYRSTIVASR